MKKSQCYCTGDGFSFATVNSPCITMSLRTHDVKPAVSPRTRLCHVLPTGHRVATSGRYEEVDEGVDILNRLSQDKNRWTPLTDKEMAQLKLIRVVEHPLNSNENKVLRSDANRLYLKVQYRSYLDQENKYNIWVHNARYGTSGSDTGYYALKVPKSDTSVYTLTEHQQQEIVSATKDLHATH